MTAKHFLRSRSVWGVAVAALGIAFGWSPELQTAVTGDVADIADKVITLAGLALALYGRVKAQGPLRFGGRAGGTGSGSGLSPAVAGALLLAAGVLGGVAPLGCAKGTQLLADHEPAARAVVEIATAEVVAANPGLAPTLATSARALQGLVYGTELGTPGALRDYVVQVALWDTLDWLTQQRLYALCDVAEEAARTLGANLAPDDQRAATARVLGWIAAIAEAAPASSPAPAVACHDEYDFSEAARRTNQRLGLAASH